MPHGLERFDDPNWAFVPMKERRGGARLRHKKISKPKEESPSKLLTKKLRLFITENYQKLTNNEIAEKLGISPQSVQKSRKKLGLSKPRFVFSNGCVPWNKGKKLPGYGGKETWFKGNQNIEHPIGKILLFKTSTKSLLYYYIKTSDKKWELLHKIIWRAAMGEIPKGTIIRFKDKNTLNCDLPNLYASTKSKLITEVTINRYSPELVAVMRLYGKLKRKIKENEKSN